MKVTFSTENNENIVVLPYVKDDGLSIDYGSANNEELDTVAGSTIIALGGNPLTSLSLSGEFPKRKEKWMETEALEDPQDYVNFFLERKDERKPFRVVITRSDDKEVLNKLVACESFKVDTPMVNGDVPYELSLIEYRKAAK